VAQVCDVVYVLRRDQFERHALADRQALIASGRIDDLSRLGSVDEQLDEWDAWLNAEPQASQSHLSVEQLEERQALGVA
jgi:predicted methyltransferase MtxX (methanogen marker protein 4)